MGRVLFRLLGKEEVNTIEQSFVDFPIEILNVEIKDGFKLSIKFSWLLIAFLILLILIIWFFRKRRKSLGLVELEISLGGIGKATLKPNYNDIQISHKIWTELITRKAAIRIDPQNDLIVEVYNSWYELFKRTRELISDIPAELVRNSESTKLLVNIATRSLNDGLRPHLTKWQVKFRNWYAHQDDKLKEASPQEVQRLFPEFVELIDDLNKVNEQLISYAEELKKITDGK